LLFSFSTSELLSAKYKQPNQTVSQLSKSVITDLPYPVEHFGNAQLNSKENFKCQYIFSKLTWIKPNGNRCVKLSFALRPLLRQNSLGKQFPQASLREKQQAKH